VLEPAINDIIVKSETMRIDRKWQGGVMVSIHLHGGQTSTILDAYNYLVENRVNFILHNALVRGYISKLSEHGHGVTNNFGYFSFTASNYDGFELLLRLLAEAEYAPLSLQEAIEFYNYSLREYGDSVRARGS